MICLRGSSFDFYIPNDLVGYINNLEPLTEVNCELEVKNKISKDGSTSLSVRLLDIDGLLSNEK